MSASHEFHADEVRAAARRIQALPDDTGPLRDRIAEAARLAADANPGFASATGLAAIAEDHGQSVAGLGERLTDQADRILRAVDDRESGDEDAAAEFDRIDPPS